MRLLLGGGLAGVVAFVGILSFHAGANDVAPPVLAQASPGALVVTPVVDC